MDPDMAVTRSHCDGNCGWNEIPDELLPYYHNDEVEHTTSAVRGHGHSHMNGGTSMSSTHTTALERARALLAESSRRTPPRSTATSRSTLRRTVTQNGQSTTTTSTSGNFEPDTPTEAEQYAAVDMYPLGTDRRKKSSLRRSVTPIRNLAPPSQARIARAKKAFDLDNDVRTCYTYATTRSYMTAEGEEEDYESPQLCRVHIRHHEMMKQYREKHWWRNWVSNLLTAAYDALIYGVSTEASMQSTPGRNVKFNMADDTRKGLPNKAATPSSEGHFAHYINLIFITIVSLLSLISSTAQSSATHIAYGTSSAASGVTSIMAAFLHALSSASSWLYTTLIGSLEGEGEGRVIRRRVTRSTAVNAREEKGEWRLCGLLPLWLCLALLLLLAIVIARSDEEDREQLMHRGGVWLSGARDGSHYYYMRTMNGLSFVPLLVRSTASDAWGELGDAYIIVRSSLGHGVHNAYDTVVNTVTLIPSLTIARDSLPNWPSLPTLSLPAIPTFSLPAVPSLPTYRSAPSVDGSALTAQLDALTVRLTLLEGGRYASTEHNHDDRYALKGEVRELRRLIAQLRIDVDGHDARITANKMELSTAIGEWHTVVATLRSTATTLQTHMHDIQLSVTNVKTAVGEESNARQAEMASVKASVTMLGSQDGGATPSFTADQLATLALIPTLLARLDALEGSIDNGLASLADGRKEVSAVDLKMIADLQEQQEAFVDLRQQVVSLSAQFVHLSTDKEGIASLVASHDSLRASHDGLAAEISSMNVGGKGNGDIMAIVRAALATYDADKTGMVDYALESAGGHIVSTRCTVTYASNTRKESVFGIPLWYSNYSPRTIIQRKSQSLSAGECWAVEGAAGSVLIGLNGWINMTAVTYEHLPLRNSPDQHLESAPKLMQVWGFRSEHDEEARQLGEFVYDVEGTPLQTFVLDQQQFPSVARAYPMVEWRILSNHGAPSYTCLYRLRVHGSRHYPHYGQEHP